VSKNGISPGEWVSITFNLTEGVDLKNVVDQLDMGVGLRIGAHLISLPDGSSESAATGVTAITAPEPASITSMGISALSLLYKKRF
jgi:hypothetical protein